MWVSCSGVATMVMAYRICRQSEALKTPGHYYGLELRKANTEPGGGNSDPESTSIGLQLLEDAIRNNQTRSQSNMNTKSSMVPVKKKNILLCHRDIFCHVFCRQLSWSLSPPVRWVSSLISKLPRYYGTGWALPSYQGVLPNMWLFGGVFYQVRDSLTFWGYGGPLRHPVIPVVMSHSHRLLPLLGSRRWGGAGFGDQVPAGRPNGHSLVQSPTVGIYFVF